MFGACRGVLGGGTRGRRGGTGRGVEVVALDPSAPYAAAIRRLLPQPTIVVDHRNLAWLANQAVTEVRQRVAPNSWGATASWRDQDHRGGVSILEREEPGSVGLSPWSAAMCEPSSAREWIPSFR